MARVLFTPEADQDSSAIIDDLVERAGLAVADRYEALFDRIYERLAAHPRAGSPRPRLGRHVRICVVAPFVIFYEHIEADDCVIILRLAHGRRKFTRKFIRPA